MARGTIPAGTHLSILIGSRLMPTPLVAVQPRVTRVAMWSGPRNVSTAMMRSWDARDDAFVCDEPLYAHYLSVTQDKRHPGYEVTLASHNTDWRRVTEWLTGPPPAGKTVFYQKHMAHHLLPNIDRNWIDSLSNCLLIRRPDEVLASLAEFFPDPRPEDTGLPQQVEIYERLLERTGEKPPVIDSRDILLDPPSVLAKLCERLGLRFVPEMLRWSPGLRVTDGAWAPDWYGKVAITTGFGPYREQDVSLPTRLATVRDACQPLYDQLYAHRIK